MVSGTWPVMTGLVIVALAVSVFAVVHTTKSYRETRRQEARTYRAVARSSRAYAEIAELQGRQLDAAKLTARSDDFDAKAILIEQRYGRASNNQQEQEQR